MPGPARSLTGMVGRDRLEEPPADALGGWPRPDGALPPTGVPIRSWVAADEAAHLLPPSPARAALGARVTGLVALGRRNVEGMDRRAREGPGGGREAQGRKGGPEPWRSVDTRRSAEGGRR